MSEDFGSGLESLLALSSSASPILQVASARAATQLLGGSALSYLQPYGSNASSLLQDPRVTGELWLPDAEALDLAARSPRRDNILAELSVKPVSWPTLNFLRVAGPSYDFPGRADSYDRQGAGNAAVVQLARLGSQFDPDVNKLFLIYLALFRRATSERFDCFTKQFADQDVPPAINMPWVVPGYAGALTTSWQLAWAASRKPVVDLVEQLRPALVDPSPKSQWAAAQFLEEAVRYREVREAPVFGGGSGPPAPPAHFPTRAVEVSAPSFRTEQPPSSPSLAEPPRRYADIVFLRDNNAKPGEAIPNTMTLRTERWYWLEVAVRAKPIGLDSDEPPKPMRPVKQKTPIDVLVTVRSDNFEIEPNLGQITLPITGDSTGNARFRVRHKGTQLTARIEVRLFYRLNLLEYLTVTAKVGPQEQMEVAPVHSKHQENLSRELLDFDEFLPRAMNIHVEAKDGIYHLEFTLEGKEAEKIALRGRSKLSNEDLDDKLTRLRAMLQNLSLKDYLHKLKGSPDEFREAIWTLAKFGRQLRRSLFAKPAGSDMDLIGKELEERPIEEGGLIQVSLSLTGSRFIYPWAFMYDLELPKQEYELPDIAGFWGYRYGIEQLLVDNPSDTDSPEQIEGKLQMAFMLWEEFPNAAEQRSLMADLVSASQNEIQISDPPITTKDGCYAILRKGTNPILYFYTHGYCRKRKTSADLPDLAAFVKKKMDLAGNGTAEWDQLNALKSRLEKRASDPDNSYIELSHGRLYYFDLLDDIDELASRPFVFLNMCESAEIIPFLQENFVSLFLDLKARAVIGTECEMSVTFAHPFSKVFLRELFRGERVVDALRTTRRQFLDRQNPLGLAYTLFGSGTMRFLPARIATITNL